MRVHPGLRIHGPPLDAAGLVFAVGISVLGLEAARVLGPLAAASVGDGVLLAPVLRAIRG